ncbi:MAG: alpha-amylase [Ignavibacteria bacterium]|jgi:hypothetical protein|nr:alpha-amylase [Ignavibacteria bacterium]
MNNFYKIYNIVKALPKSDIYIPSIWSGNDAGCNVEKVDFPNFLLTQFDKIIDNPLPFDEKANPNIYNLMVRYATAFDHSQDGSIKNEPGKFKETGTFLKTIALLPYIKSLGTDILYLLPITAIGCDGKKGNLGSPYSIRDPYTIDQNLNENLLNIAIDVQLAALIEAAHNIGIKVVCEFIFRTASKDSNLALIHPEWFYWIKDSVNNFASPIFTPEELLSIKTKVEALDLHNLPEPHFDYQSQFSEPPIQVDIVDGKISGTCKDGTQVKIPGAFADWPPDDIQPAWSDVTYLKLYDNPSFNYIAYNTVRMYDTELTKPQHEATLLWRYIENIIPFYKNNFGIDGVMIDMGHSLPPNLLRRIISKAKRNDSDFFVWEENFTPAEESVKQGFALVLGYLPFDQYDCEKMRDFITRIQNNNFPLALFGTPETHNTPRAATRDGGSKFSKIAYTTNALLPIPTFIHSGFELCETLPVNTGLGFDNIDTTALTPDKLPLFSTATLDWNNTANLIDFIKEANEVANKYINPDDDIHTRNLVKLVECTTDNILAFVRATNAENKYLLFVANYTQSNLSDDTLTLQLNMPVCCQITRLLGDGSFQYSDGELMLSLHNYGFALLLLEGFASEIDIKEINNEIINDEVKNEKD